MSRPKKSGLQGSEDMENNTWNNDELCRLIDGFLGRLDNEKNVTLLQVDKKPDTQNAIIARQTMIQEKFITLRNPLNEKTSIVDITIEGKNMMNAGGYRNFLKARHDAEVRKAYIESLEIEKTKYDIELAKKIIKDYQTTKWIARISLLIGILLSVYALFEKIFNNY